MIGSLSGLNFVIWAGKIERRFFSAWSKNVQKLAIEAPCPQFGFNLCLENQMTLVHRFYDSQTCPFLVVEYSLRLFLSTSDKGGI